MPRYFFHIARGRTVITDPEGDVLRSDDEAIRHARTVAQEMVEQRHRYVRRGIERWAFRVTDRNDRHVATVPFSKSPWLKAMRSKSN